MIRRIVSAAGRMSRLWNIVLFTGFISLGGCSFKPELVVISGTVFGTSYSIQYYSEKAENYEAQFDSLFYAINKSLSTYQANSIISKLNRNERVLIDAHFQNVFEASHQIYSETNGLFDPTIGVIVNAWDFGPEGEVEALDSLRIDSLMQFVGLNRVNRINKVILKPQATYLDFNAIAKGYAVDVIAEFLDSRQVRDYLVEIGGELRAKGLNLSRENFWKVGVETPNFEGEQSVFKAITLDNAAMATSGTYRKFKVDSAGNRYAHIINTQTGYPTKTNILSVSVIASNCMEADAYATAFQAMGEASVGQFLESRPDLKVFMIRESENGSLETTSLNGFPED